ncbi:hypothetical protein AQZ52_14945 [Novosphingobium fuchskuhlense]|uniref:Uncharacterized protein n=1 Tax=Novosphingobium fuchskuhlense TaxID=1117702 RepID=A0A124JTG3_9SPHN|nr:hypothetical protein [Novosphingobium fuchskuhlense]KUR70158.1 hypothetical protein AQZ52_14945 [Novosphingobium fuchskuhlense]
MSTLGATLAKQGRAAALGMAAFAFVFTSSKAQAAECPDASTVSAARLIEFKTMLMVVGLRCKSVGVMMADHNDEMANLRSTMFEEANRRLRRYIAESDRITPVAVAPAPPVEPEPEAAPPPPRARAVAGPRGKAGGRMASKGRGRVVARGGAARGGAARGGAARGGAARGGLAKGPARPPAAGPAKARAGLAKAAPAAAKPAPRSKREDPYEMYLTRVGTLYGMGDNSLGTCRNFDELVVYLSDPTTPNRALTDAAERIVPTTVLEKQRNCVARP